MEEQEKKSVFERLEEQIKDLSEDTISDKILQPTTENNVSEEEVKQPENIENVSETTISQEPVKEESESTTENKLEKKEPVNNVRECIRKWGSKEKVTPSTQVWLTESQRNIAKIIGEGKISVGIKEALNYYAQNHIVE